MPNRWPIANGNWSNAAIWSGSLIPTAADDVFLNNRTVTLDQNIAVLTIRNTATGSAVAGGILAITESYNITASNGLNSSGASTTSGMIQFVGSGTLDISSSIIDSGRFTINNASTGTIRMVGNVFGPTGTQPVFAIQNTSTGTIIVTGSVFGGNLNYNGKYGIYNASAGKVYVSGSVTGGQGGQSANGVANASVGFVEIIGTVSGGPAGGTEFAGSNPGVFNAGTLIVKGPISASIRYPGVTSTSTTATNIFTGPFYNTGSWNAVYAYRMQIIEPTSTTWTFDTETGGTKTLYTSNQLPGVPRQTDVRKGTQYNFGLTGSLEMPDPTTVKAGVAVDNTTGSAVLTAQDMFNVLTQDITQTGSIGETLKNVSSVQTVGATISSFKV